MTSVFYSAFIVAAALASPALDAPAPQFAGAASNGDEIKLDDFKGRPVVLEWTNDGCPFVRKHYETGNMQQTRKTARADGVAWIRIISSAPGKQGYGTADRADRLTEVRGAPPDFVVLDGSGAIGKAYGAKTTPHMFVIDGAGVLRYAGAIDDKPSTDHKTIEGAKNYVTSALENLAAGKPVSLKSTQPYGCSVKYGS